MLKENVLYVILYCILFIDQYYKTNASPIGNQDVINHVKTVIQQENAEDYIDRMIYDAEYTYEDPCPDCDYIDRKNKRHTDPGSSVTEKFPGPLRPVSNDFLKYSNLMRSFNKPKKSADMFISRGWGAGGMPFNVLYTPTSTQQKILRSIPEKVVISPISVYPPVAEPLALSAPRPPAPVAYDLVQEQKDDQSNKKQYHKFTLKGFQKQAPTRRHYSIIPQLFVSYGWGPLGK